MTGMRSLPSGVWALGLVSLCMDVSSEMIHSLLPVFLVTTLGASALTVGLIEGVAEATALITKLFSGLLSDRLGKRKPLAIAGYGLAALTKPIFALAGSVGWVLTARFADRIGKGIRGAPRDALIADITPDYQRGAAYGLRQSLDSVGALAGPLLAIVLMGVFTQDIRAVFWVAVIPALLAVIMLIFGVHEPVHTDTQHKRPPPLQLNDLRAFGSGFWLTVALGGVLMLARFSEAFLVLRAEQLQLSLTWIPLVLVIMNIVYAATSYPAGRLSDRVGRRALLETGVGVLIIADLILALLPTLEWALFGIALWGLHMGLTHGILAALVADAAPAHLRGSAFGVFNLVSGVALLVASVLAGWLWDSHGASTTFLAGAGFALIAAVGLLFVRRRDNPASNY